MKRILSTLSLKWPEYLLEIIVIVIGILGAFALSNWNDNQNLNQERIELVNQLILDYEANHLQLNQKLKLHEAVVEASFDILSYMDYPETVERDSLLTRLSITIIDPTFDPISNDLLGSGKISLIKNEELNRLLSNWSSDIVALREIELMWQRMDYENLIITLSELGIFRDVTSSFWQNKSINNQWLLGKPSGKIRAIPKSKEPSDIQQVLNHKILEGILSEGILLNQSALEMGGELNSRIERTLELLYQEIE